jgi:hypothetical protein
MSASQNRIQRSPIVQVSPDNLGTLLCQGPAKPLASRWRATEPPCCPVAPLTTIILSNVNLYFPMVLARAAYTLVRSEESLRPFACPAEYTCPYRQVRAAAVPVGGRTAMIPMRTRSARLDIGCLLLGILPTLKCAPRLIVLEDHRQVEVELGCTGNGIVHAHVDDGRPVVVAIQDAVIALEIQVGQVWRRVVPDVNAW